MDEQSRMDVCAKTWSRENPSNVNKDWCSVIKVRIKVGMHYGKNKKIVILK